MISRFPDGHHQLRSRQSALTQAGGPSSLGVRHAGGLSAHPGTPRIAAHTGRPGPQPPSAHLAIGVAARTSQSQRAVAELIRHAHSQSQVRLPTLPYAAYQPGAAGRMPWQQTKKDAFGQTWYATQVQGIVVYTHQINNWGDQEFVVINPKTHTSVHFIPLGYVPAPTSIQATASATGEFGRVYANTLGTIVVVATGGVALEAGAGSLALDYAAPYFTTEALTGFGIRAGTDFGVQFVSGFATSPGSFLDRSGTALANINGSSVLVAGILNTEGLELKLPAKLLMSGGTAAAGNLVTMSYGNIIQYGSFLHGVDLHNSSERNEFLIGVGTSALLDVGKEGATDWLAPKAARLLRRSVAMTEGQAVPATLRVITAKQFTVPLSFGIGTSIETVKKAKENRDKAKEESEAKERAAHHRPGVTAHRPPSH